MTIAIILMMVVRMMMVMKIMMRFEALLILCKPFNHDYVGGG